MSGFTDRGLHSRGINNNAHILQVSFLGPNPTLVNEGFTTIMPSTKVGGLGRRKMTWSKTAHQVWPFRIYCWFYRVFDKPRKSRTLFRPTPVQKSKNPHVRIKFSHYGSYRAIFGKLFFFLEKKNIFHAYLSYKWALRAHNKPPQTDPLP